MWDEDAVFDGWGGKMVSNERRTQRNLWDSFEGSGGVALRRDREDRIVKRNQVGNHSSSVSAR